MMRLDDREWKPCRLSSLGKVESGRDIYALERVDGDIPYITSGSQNNGIGYFVDNKNDTYDKGYIAFNRNGAVGLAFYHPYWSVMGNDCRKLHLSEANENLYVGLFVATAISMQSKSFSYSRKLGTGRANKLQIMLPFTDAGEPDYQFMEDYIRELMAEKKKQYQGYVKQRIAELCDDHDYQQVDWKSMIDSHEWEPFQIDTIFNILPGKRLVATDSSPGDRPFIGALDNSNGVARFVSDKNESLDKNVLGVNYNGNGMVIGFYHPYECIFSDDVKRFHLKDREDDQFVLLFMKTAILMQKHKFGYLYKFNAERMAHTSIMLPVISTGKPDYDFMESFGRKMMLQKYQQYLGYIRALSIE